MIIMLYYFFRSKLCHFDVNLTYPQNGIIPDVHFAQPAQREIPFTLMKSKRTFFQQLKLRATEESKSLTKRDLQERDVAKQNWKRDLSGRANGTVDPWVWGFHSVRHDNVWPLAFCRCAVRLLLARYVHRLRHQLYLPVELVFYRSIPD